MYQYYAISSSSWPLPDGSFWHSLLPTHVAFSNIHLLLCQVTMAHASRCVQSIYVCTVGLYLKYSCSFVFFEEHFRWLLCAPSWPFPFSPCYSISGVVVNMEQILVGILCYLCIQANSCDMHWVCLWRHAGGVVTMTSRKGGGGNSTVTASGEDANADEEEEASAVAMETEAWSRGATTSSSSSSAVRSSLLLPVTCSADSPEVVWPLTSLVSPVGNHDIMIKFTQISIKGSDNYRATSTPHWQSKPVQPRRGPASIICHLLKTHASM